MNRFLILTASIIVCLTLINNCQSYKVKKSQEKHIASKELGEYLDKQAKDAGFNGIVAIYVGQTPAYVNSYLTDDLSQDYTVSKSSRFMIGSVTKQFTAASILLLAERKLLSIDDTIDKYFPDFPYGNMIRIKNLLNHTSGLQRDPFYDYMIERIDKAHFDEFIIKRVLNKNELRFITNSYYYDPASKKYLIKKTVSFNNRMKILNIIFLTCYISETLNYDVDSMLKEAIVRDKIKALFYPGVRYSYSNFGYIILSSIIEKAGGMNYNDFVRKNIFEPLGMVNSGFGYDKNSSNLLIEGYTDYDEKLPQKIDMSFWPGGAGSAYSSAADLNKWLSSFADNSILSKESVDTLFNSFVETGNKRYGYGFMINDYDIDDIRISSINHNGCIFSFNSSVHFLPDFDIKIILLSSKQNYNYLQEKWIKDIYSIIIKNDVEIKNYFVKNKL
ncbi:MAG TPA: serine hydrolase domain-containing protein [Spirochaetota bacterium]|nr:serine hydrolase domain-containing protein [Spirochaetota bacterium]HOS55776.1 serine hydrolase domain-containing protein [Spirochaetota bacterium]HQF76712.1 serine hydrolase domain-containing protein [Spirochaetota bacterium]HQH29269.1 serine hydrolase domain-containing protein [Spirochaetota bacterium]HQJ04787.1 serine hydrolase domain-containing protein [Spirochaetota bacterium]